jgi:hypothetical protein
MSRKIMVKPFAIEQGLADAYDLVIGTTGYEARARYVFEKWSPRANLRWAPAFTYRQELSFEANKHFFGSSGYDTDAVDDTRFRIEIAKRFRQAAVCATDNARCVFLLTYQVCRDFEWRVSLKLQRPAHTLAR